jgi:hypothetical protein
MDLGVARNQSKLIVRLNYEADDGEVMFST